VTNNNMRGFNGKTLFTPDDDAKLLRLRAAGMSYREIAEKHFPGRTVKSLTGRVEKLRYPVVSDGTAPKGRPPKAAAGEAKPGPAKAKNLLFLEEERMRKNARRATEALGQRISALLERRMA
jgi:hypothetical protein